jgi:hypothetical protein
MIEKIPVTKLAWSLINVIGERGIASLRQPSLLSLLRMSEIISNGNEGTSKAWNYPN